MIERILVPTDFSPAPEPAIDCAVELGRRFGAELLRARAVHPSIPSSGSCLPRQVRS